jgi:hypothetical protein
LNALDRIQNAVFTKAGLKPGDYSVLSTQIKHLFMHPAATVLEEYGIPYKITNTIINQHDLGGDVDAYLYNLKRVNLGLIPLSTFEREMTEDAIANI